MTEPDPDRREPFTPLEAMRLDDPTSDHAIILKACDDGWIALRDLQVTMARRDHRWTPDHVRVIVDDLCIADLLMTLGRLTRPDADVVYRRRPDGHR